MPQIDRVSDATPELRAAILAPLQAYSRLRGLVWQPTSLVLVLKEDTEVVGGLIGHYHWEWLQIEVLAVVKHLRGQGWGKRLMAEAEQIGVTAGCHHAWVDTFSFQAPGFYEKLGYRIFGELPEYPTGQTRFFLAKQLLVEGKPNQE
jgi:ribosomal protein S18 acetylase RimI-like enzyme